MKVPFLSSLIFVLNNKKLVLCFYYTFAKNKYMLQSMTGYGKASVDFEDKTISIEIRSLNSKGLDASLRMPSLYREKEIELRAELEKLFESGKVDVSITIEYRSEQPSLQINTALAEVYFR